MTNRPNPLLDAVFAPDSAPASQAGSLAATLAAARQRRVTRRVVPAVLGTAGVVVLLLLSNPPRPTPLVVHPAAPTPERVKVVSTRPLPAAMQVQTRTDTVKLVSSRQDSVVMVSTDATRPHVQEIDDRQLLALAGRAAALIRQAGEQVRLVFLEETNELVVPQE